MYLYKAKIIRVIDSDTFDCTVDLGFTMTTTQRLRLLGVQCPEAGTKAGDIATELVKKIFEDIDHKVQIQTEKTGSFGRWLATVYVPQSLNKMLIEEGIAKEYKK